MPERPELMINSSQFTRGFSKDHAQSLRNETASKIRETRNRYRNSSMTYQEIKASNDQVLIDAYDRLKNNFWGKIFKSEKYLAEHAHYPSGYLDFWKQVEPKIADFVGEIYDEIKADQGQ